PHPTQFCLCACRRRLSNKYRINIKIAMRSSRKYPDSATATTNRKVSVSHASVRVSVATVAAGRSAAAFTGFGRAAISAERVATGSDELRASPDFDCGVAGVWGVLDVDLVFPGRARTPASVETVPVVHGVE